MKKISVVLMVAVLLCCTALSGCGKKEAQSAETEVAAFDGTLRVLNIKSEVNQQIVDLAAAYTKETGIQVEIIEVGAGVDAQATLKGYYLSDQMPDIIACEAAGFGNWEGL